MRLAFKHSGRLGDIICALPLVQQMSLRANQPAEFYIPCDVPSHLGKDVYHPGGDLMVSQALFDFIAPLMRAQPYLAQVAYLPGAQVPADCIDLDAFRAGSVNLKAGMIQGWYRKAFGTAFALEEKWLTVPAGRAQPPQWDVLVNHTTRFCNTSINYRVLQGLPNVGFIGLRYEYEHFMQTHGLTGIAHVEMVDALQMAGALSSARVVVGNQSMCFAVAEGLKATRALEVYEPVPTAIPVGGLCTEYITTAGLASFLSDVLGRRVETLPDLPGEYVDSVKAQEGWRPPMKQRLRRWWRQQRQARAARRG